MTESDAIELAKRFVENLVRQGELFPCEFGWTVFVKADSDGPDRWYVHFPFTDEDLGGAVLHVEVEGPTSEVSIFPSL